MPTILYIVSVAGGTGDISFGIKLLLGLINAQETLLPSNSLLKQNKVKQIIATSTTKPADSNETISLPIKLNFHLIICQQAGGNPWKTLCTFIKSLDSIDPSLLLTYISYISVCIRTNQGITAWDPSISNIDTIDSYDPIIYERIKPLLYNLSDIAIDNPLLPYNCIIQGPLKILLTSKELFSMFSNNQHKNSLSIENISSLPLLTIREMGQGQFITPVINDSSTTDPSITNKDISSGFEYPSNEYGIFNELLLFTTYHQQQQQQKSTLQSITNNYSSHKHIWIDNYELFHKFLYTLRNISTFSLLSEHLNYTNIATIPRYFIGYYRTPKHSIQFSRMIISYLYSCFYSFPSSNDSQHSLSSSSVYILPILLSGIDIPSDTLDIDTNNNNSYIKYLIQGFREHPVVTSVDIMKTIVTTGTNHQSSSSITPSIIPYQSSYQVLLTLTIQSQILSVQLPLYSISQLQFPMLSFYSLLSLSLGNIVTGDATLTETISCKVPYYYSTENHKVFVYRSLYNQLLQLVKDNNNNDLRNSAKIIIQYWEYLNYGANRKNIRVEKEENMLSNTNSSDTPEDPSWASFWPLWQTTVLSNPHVITTSSLSESLDNSNSLWTTIEYAFHYISTYILQEHGHLIDNVIKILQTLLHSSSDNLK